VDVDAAGANNGTSWENAYKYLQDALIEADSALKPVEIRVAEGIYTPDSNSTDPNGSGDRIATFQLINDVSLKGSYAGFGQPDPNKRDPNTFESILSGDLDGNDIDVNDPCELLNEPTRAENSYTIVTGSRTDANAVLDGFIVTGGNANILPPPPGIPLPPNFLYQGGGLFNNGGSPTLTYCTFSRNSAFLGGGIYDYNSSPTLTNCTFSENLAYWSSGGMYNIGSSNPTLTNCTFNNNYKSAMYNIESSPSVTNSIFSRNWTDDYGGGILNYKSSPTVTNCTFADNTADHGGGMCNWDESSPTITNCTFSGNIAAGENAVGGGMYNYISSPTLTNCIFTHNSADEYGGGMYNWDHSSPIVTNCTFNDNTASYSGGGIYNWDNCSPTLINCTISSNHARAGGGMGNYSSDPTLTNCTITGNTAWVGGGMANDGRGSTLTNCIFSGNSAVSYGGGIYYSGSAPRLMNCILWSNTPEEIDFRGITPVINYSDVQGGWPGLGNINEDPCFVEPGFWDPNGTPEDANDDLWIDGDYHLKSQAGRWDPNSESWVRDDVTSPCIDAGNPGCPVGDEPNDSNNVRINMGAYGGTAEASKSPPYWRSIADITNDWIVDSNDLKVLVGYWLQTGECIPGDFDRSRFVDFNDFAIFGGQWRQKGPGPGIAYDIGGCIPVDFASSAVVEFEPTRFTVTVEGRYIYFEDTMRANCCPEELEVQMTLEDDLITIYEIEHTSMPCPCLCDFPITATFGPFEPGTYIFAVYQNSSFIGATTVTIENGQ
jgi:parallel beta-helix repeat protein